MPGYTKDEAQSFIDALRLTVAGKVGFRWMSEKLSDLAGYIDSIAEENRRLNAYIDAVGARADYESRSGSDGGSGQDSA